MVRDRGIWHGESVTEVLEALDTTTEGLSESESRSRLDRLGPNRLVEPPSRPAFLRFLDQYNDPLNYLLMAAAVIAVLVSVLQDGEHNEGIGDAIFIFIVLTANATFGYWQENRAEQAMDALKKMSSAMTKVLRSEGFVEIPADDLVPGDIVQLEIGAKVPADMRLVDLDDLSIDESTLTGESEPVEKITSPVDSDALLADRTNMAYKGTTVTNGRAQGVVVATGMRTQLGLIASDIASAETPKTPLERRLESLGVFLGWVAFVVAVVIVGIEVLFALLEGSDDLLGIIIAQFMVAIAIFVAIVPEGLPIILVITLSMGMSMMARHNALIRRMKAVETLGSTTIICSDKTGTLTKNQMTVRRVFVLGHDLDISGTGFEPKGDLRRGLANMTDEEQKAVIDHPGFQGMVRTAINCQNSRVFMEDGQWTALGNPTDSACRVLGMKFDATEGERVREVFFTSLRKRMSTVNRMEDGLVAHTKGALGYVRDRITRIATAEGVRDITDKDLTIIDAKNRDLGSEALRVITLMGRPVAEEEDLDDDDAIESNLIFYGLVGIQDPPRDEVPEAIAICQRAGIEIKMITGDNGVTAAAIAKELEIDGEGEPIDGRVLNRMDDETLSERMPYSAVFSRVTPDQKMRIVTSLQESGHVVAMTGDGVNDAPALSKADIGVAMGIAGTDVAKDAADMVLSDDNFANIVGAVEEGRKIYENIRNFVRYQISTNIAATALIVVASFIFGWPLPLTATQILVINILMDGPPAVALGVEPRHGKVMERPPRPIDEGLPNTSDMIKIFFLGTVMVIGTLLIFYISFQPSDPTMMLRDIDTDSQEFVKMQTLTFSVFVLYQLFNVMNCRSGEESLLSLGPFTNRAINLSVLISFSLLLLLVQGAALTIPLVGIQIGDLLSTTPLELMDWVVITLVASSVLIAEEGRKIAMKNRLWAPTPRK